jgi:hypothetical protein
MRREDDHDFLVEKNFKRGVRELFEIIIPVFVWRTEENSDQDNRCHNKIRTGFLPNTRYARDLYSASRLW